MPALICTHCGAEVHHSEADHIGNEIICRTCAAAYTRVCDCCGERMWAEDDRGEGATVLCSDCCNSYYVRCACCGHLMEAREAYYGDEDDDEEYPYCSDCFHQIEETIHCYSYKPEPIFHGNGPRYFGVELEVDEGGRDRENAINILKIFNKEKEYGYIKSDGSLNDGMELVTHPCTLQTHQEEVPWDETLQCFKQMGYYSHQASTCGLHVHVNRTAFGKTEQEQEESIGHVLYLFERFWQEMLRFSRRTQRQVEQWAARYGYKDSGREILKTAKAGYQGRYTCVNLLNRDTIEFRIFRGTLKHSTLIATLQMIDLICNVAIIFTEEKLHAMSWAELMLNIRKEEYPELVQYLKERRLYINEPVAAEREV